MIYLTKPENFNSRFDVAGNFIYCGDEFVLLQRQDHKPQGGTWGIPSGKVDDGETPFETICRETSEETGLIVPSNDIKFFCTIYVKHTEYDLVYHIFYTELNEKQAIKISEAEHKDAKWVSFESASGMSLIHDLEACIKLFLTKKQN